MPSAPDTAGRGRPVRRALIDQHSSRREFDCNARFATRFAAFVQAFEIAEEEQLVLADRAAERNPKMFLFIFGGRARLALGELRELEKYSFDENLCRGSRNSPAPESLFVPDRLTSDTSPRSIARASAPYLLGVTRTPDGVERHPAAPMLMRSPVGVV